MTIASAETLRDSRGLRLGTTSRAAADRADEALWQMMTFADTPGPALQAAREADAGWMLPLLLEAGFRLGLNQPEDRDAARALLASAGALAPRANARERAHLDALQQLQDGRVTAALRLWDDLLLEQPRDALAMHWAHQWDHAAVLQLPQRLQVRPLARVPT